MKRDTKITQFEINSYNNQPLISLCGPCNENLTSIENMYDAQILQRSDIFKIIGANNAIKRAEDTLNNLTKKNKPLEISHFPLPAPQMEEEHIQHKLYIQIKKKRITLSNQNQQKYMQYIKTKSMVFAIGPAGSGKTFLAVVGALDALFIGRIKKITFVSPAVEADGKLGFLPGGEQSPHLQPIYDSLYELIGATDTQKLLKDKTIEIAPIEFMHGRTLNNAFIILDEAQNTTKLQMKMFLTRLVHSSTTIITGDITQIDLPYKTESGLHQVIGMLKGTDKNIAFCSFTTNDNIRHPLVKTI